MLLPELPVETSSGLAARTPENSWTVMAIAAGEANVTVTRLTGFAFAAYQISPSE
jgi:hypothetical protein